MLFSKFRLYEPKLFFLFKKENLDGNTICKNNYKRLVTTIEKSDNKDSEFLDTLFEDEFEYMRYSVLYGNFEIAKYFEKNTTLVHRLWQDIINYVYCTKDPRVIDYVRKYRHFLLPCHQGIIGSIPIFMYDYCKYSHIFELSTQPSTRNLELYSRYPEKAIRTGNMYMAVFFTKIAILDTSLYEAVKDSDRLLNIFTKRCEREGVTMNKIIQEAEELSSFLENINLRPMTDEDKRNLGF